ncbi:MAG TPA: DUF1097 domain-containing protein [Phycisphaerae bacterium]|nr:DUF1097 domain-containing protein [Phycisphaerae bacterium]
MSFKQFFPIPVIIAVIAVALVMLAKPSPVVVPYLWTWIAFQAWAMYFLAGCTIKGGGKVMLGYLGGAVASVAIFELMGLLSSLGAAPALAIAVFIVVIGVISAERLPGFSFVPSWFIGAGVFFGVMSIFTGWQWASDCPETQRWLHYLEAGTYLMVSCLVGQVFGWVTVLCRSRYEAWVKSKHPEIGE